MRLRISPNMDFYLDMELPGVSEKSRSDEIQEHEREVFDEFIGRIRAIFPEGDYRVYTFEFDIARETNPKAA